MRIGVQEISLHQPVVDALERSSTAVLLDAESNLGTTGARTFVASNKLHMLRATGQNIDPKLQDFWFGGWVNVTSYTAYDTIFRTGAGSSGSDGFWFSLTSASRFYLEFNDSDPASTYLTKEFTKTWTAGKWHHVLVTFDRNDVATLYLDGVADSSTLNISSRQASLGTASSTMFAAYNTSADNPFSGSLDKWCYGEGTLPTPAEITALYNQGNGLYGAEVETRYPDLWAKVKHCWNCNENTPSSPMYDCKNTNHFTPVGAELLSNTTFSTRTGRTWANLIATDKAHLKVGTAAAINLADGDFFLTASVKRTTTGNEVIAAKYKDADNYWKLEITAAHFVRFFARASAADEIDITCSTTELAAGTVYYIALLVDRSDSANTKCYVNAASQSFSVNTVSADTIDNTGDLYLGQLGDGTLYLDAYLAQVGIGKITDYGATAAACQLAAGTTLRNSNLGQYHTEIAAGDRTTLGLTAYWDLSQREYDSAGTVTATDSVGTNHLTMVGAELVTNGTFTARDTDLMTNGTFDSATTGWTGSGATLASVAGGEAGNCLEITNSGAAKGEAQSAVFTTVAGQAYTLIFNHKNGTGMGAYKVGTAAGGDQLVAATAVDNAAWTAVTKTFYATGTSTYVTFICDSTTSGHTALFDTVTLQRDLPGWTNHVTYPWDTACEYSSAKMRLAQTGDGTPVSGIVYQDASLTSGNSYVVSWDGVKTSGSMNLGYRDSSSGWSSAGYSATMSATGSSGPTTFAATASNKSFAFVLSNNAAADWTIDNVSVKSASIRCVSDADVFGSWTEGAASGDSRVAVDTHTAYGSSGLALRLDMNSANQLSYVTQGVMAVGHEYTVSGYAKANTGAQFSIGFGSGTTVTIGDPGSTWATFASTSTCSGSVYLAIQRSTGASKSLWFDSVSCKCTGPIPCAGPREATASDTVGSCLTATSKIHTPYGYITAEDAFNRKVDRIFSRSGGVQNITGHYVRPHVGDVIQIQCRGWKTEVTPEHKVLVVKAEDMKSWKQRNYTRAYRNTELIPADFIETAWVAAGEVKPGDFAVFPLSSFDDCDDEYVWKIRSDNINGCSSKYNRDILLTENVAELIGWYVAEGSSSGGRTNIALNVDDDVARVAWLVESVFGKTPHLRQIGNAVRVDFACKPLADALSEACGHDCYEKKFPEWIVNGNEGIVKAALRGWLAGDGHQNFVGLRQKDSPQSEGATVSGVLCAQVTHMMSQLGIVPSYHLGHTTIAASQKNMTPYHRIIVRGSQLAKLFDDEIKESRTNMVFGSDEAYAVITHVSRSEYDGQVYDFTTEDHAIPVPFIIHNSHGVLTNMDAVAAWSTDVPTQLVGKVAGSLVFATNDYVLSSSNTGVAQNVAGVTLSVWVKPTDTSGSEGVLWVSKNTSGLVRARIILIDDTIRASGRKLDADTPQDVTSASVVTAAWQHVSAVFNYTTDTIEIYRNGVSVAGPTVVVWGSGSVSSNTAPYEIVLGATSTSTQYLAATICDARIYNSALSPADIALLAAGNEPTATAVAHWPLDDGPQGGEPANGDPISVWIDRQNSYQFVQTTAAYRPTLNTTGVGGKQGIAFASASAQRLVYSGELLQGNKGAVLFVVDRGATGADEIVFSQNDTATATKYLRLGLDSTDKIKIQQREADVADVLTGDGAPGTGVAVVAIWSDGSDYFASINNVTQVLTPSGGANTGNWGDVTTALNTVIGAAIDSGGGSSYLNSCLAILAAWDEVPSNLTSIVRGLMSRYGL